MEEIAAVPMNGRTVVSTFSGCGGSCLGFRWAGFQTLWANEFIPAAREVYAANFPSTYLDARDLRTVTPDEILEQCGLEAGEVDVLEGSPPCASFSPAGKGQAGWNLIRQSSETKQRVDDLFWEFARIVRGVQPRVFVAENVPGLQQGKAVGYFKAIFAELQSAGYVVEARLLDAQWLGVPQTRRRLIFIGVRTDLASAPAFPRPLLYRYSIRDALPYVERVVHDTKGQPQYSMGEVTNKPCPAITVAGGGAPFHYMVDARIDQYAIGAEWDKLRPGESSERYFNLVKPDPGAPCPTITQTGGVKSAASVTHPTERRKFTPAELRRLCGFPDDFILTGTYQQQWERMGRAVPPPVMRAIAWTIAEEILGVV